MKHTVMLVIFGGAKFRENLQITTLQNKFSWLPPERMSVAAHAHTVHALAMCYQIEC